MSEEQRKQMAFLAGTLWKLTTGQPLDDNEIQSLDNGLAEYYLDAHRNDGVSVRGPWDTILVELLEQEAGRKRRLP